MTTPFESIDGDISPTEIESYCMNCGENGITRLLLTVIPHFKQVILMAFECPHCGTKNNEIQSGSAIAEKGCISTLKVSDAKDLSRQIVKSESASISFKELDFEIPPSTQRGILSTIEGILDRAIEGLSQEQDQRKELDLNLYEKVQDVISKLKEYMDGKESFTFILNDPSGNSYIENLCMPNPDPKIHIQYYIRTREQEEFLGLAAPDSTFDDPNDPNALHTLNESHEESPEESNTFNTSNPNEISNEQDEFTETDQVHVFPGNCSRCLVPCETKMHMLEIPHFKNVIIMSTVCDACGYKSNEVKSGGAISSKGKKISLILTDLEDLSRNFFLFKISFFNSFHG